jgi:hypothetical protein
MKFKNMFKKSHRNTKMLPTTEEYESKDNFPFKVSEGVFTDAGRASEQVSTPDDETSQSSSPNWQGLVKNNVSLWNEKNKKQVLFKDTEDTVSEESEEVVTTINRQNSIRRAEVKTPCCSLCDNTNDTQLIVLECKHSFHIKCLAEIDHDDSKNYMVLDNAFFKDRKCITCNYTIDTTELMYIHSKYTKNIKDTINDCDITIKDLENKLRKVKEQMKKSFECKQKLEFSQNKSKQLIIMLNTEID